MTPRPDPGQTNLGLGVFQSAGGLVLGVLLPNPAHSCSSQNKRSSSLVGVVPSFHESCFATYRPVPGALTPHVPAAGLCSVSPWNLRWRLWLAGAENRSAHHKNNFGLFSLQPRLSNSALAILSAFGTSTDGRDGLPHLDPSTESRGAASARNCITGRAYGGPVRTLPMHP